MNKRSFDAIIIGSGQAGTPLAFKMAGMGHKVAFVERRHFGGSCINTGCTPTKTYVASARTMWEAGRAAGMGVVLPEGARIDLKKVKQRKDALTASMARGIEQGLREHPNISLFTGEAAFAGHKCVKVDEHRLQAAQIFINVGARPHVPEAFRKLSFLTNESILALEELPGHLIIIGGSYVGLEFGQIFRRFGSRVSIIENMDSIVAHEDREISDLIHTFLHQEGIDLYTGADCVEAGMEEDGRIGVSVSCHDGETRVTGSHLLVAVGRKPNTDTLNLDATGLKAGKKGFIEVDEYLETGVKGIYALGDCNGRGAFTHTSYNDYEIVSGNLFDGQNRKVTDRIPTYCLYTDPPLGRAGMTKKEALAKGLHVMEAKIPMKDVNRAREKDETHGMMQLIIDAGSEKILGGAILGTGGDEIISGIVNAMAAGTPYPVLRDAVIPHPTVAELIPSMLGSLSKPD